MARQDTKNTIVALARYLYGAPPVEIAKQVYGLDAADDYLEAKERIIERNPIAWMLELDDRRIEKLAKIVERQS